MNIRIKHIRQTLLLLSALSTLNTYSMESQKSIKIDETAANIRANTDKATKKCKMHCSFLQNLLSGGRCEDECMQEYTQQHDKYLARKYTTLCTEEPFNEGKWRHKTKPQEINDDMTATQKAFLLWSNSETARCTQKCLKQIKQIQELVKREKDKTKITLPELPN